MFMMSFVSTVFPFKAPSNRTLISLGNVSDSNLMLAKACFNVYLFVISIVIAYLSGESCDYNTVLS